jgi:hypothetical protein
LQVIDLRGFFAFANGQVVNRSDQLVEKQCCMKKAPCAGAGAFQVRVAVLTGAACRVLSRETLPNPMSRPVLL